MDEEEPIKFDINTKLPTEDEDDLIQHEVLDYEEEEHEELEEYFKQYKKCLCKDTSYEEEYICECFEEEEECICEEGEEDEEEKIIVKPKKGKFVPITLAVDEEEEKVEEEEKKVDEDAKSEVGEAEEVEEEEFLHVEEEVVEKVLIDREALKAEHNVLMVSGAILKKDNDSYHKKLANYFKRKRMEHVLHDVNPKFKDELCKKMEDKLKTYETLRALEYEHRTRECKELDEMIIAKSNKIKTFNEEFSNFLHREKEVATGLKSLRNGQELPEKIIDRFISRQSAALESLSKNRVLYLKAKNALLAKIEATKKLEVIGPGLTLAMYDQLLLYHATSTDKIQEKTAELEVIRMKCDQETGILGHIREKLDVTHTDIKYNEEMLDDLANTVVSLRQYIANHCINKDETRKEISKLKMKHALLFNKELLCDMYACTKSIEKMKVEISQLKVEHFDLAGQVSNLRLKQNQHYARASNKSEAPYMNNSKQRRRPCKRKPPTTVPTPSDCRVTSQLSTSTTGTDAYDIYASPSTRFIPNLVDIV